MNLTKYLTPALLAAVALLTACSREESNPSKPSPNAIASKTFAGNGIYWNPAESGTGFFFEGQGNTGVASFYLYEEGTGKAVWYSAVGLFELYTDGTYKFSGELQSYKGGQPMGSTAAQAPVATPNGPVSIDFDNTGKNATITLPKRKFSATRYNFAGIEKLPTATQPEAGVYWSPEQPGRSFTIEVQNNTAVVTAYHYNADGTPTWNVLFADITSGTATGAFNAFQGGQTLHGAYVAPTGPISVGALTAKFTQPCNGQVVFNGTTVINLQRFAFGGLAPGEECRAKALVTK